MLKILCRKELRQIIRTFRLPGFLIILAFFALLDPPMIKYMDKLLASVVTEMQITMPPPTPEMAFGQFFKDVSSLGVLVLILVTMGSIANEKASGITAWMLTRPVTRSQYITAKIITWGLAVIICVLATSTLAYLYTWTLLGAVELSAAAMAVVGLLVWLLFIATLTIFGSTVLRSSLAAGGLSLAVVFAGSSLQVISSADFYKYLPFSLSANSLQVASGAMAGSELVPALIITLVLTAGLIAATHLRFRRLELT